MDARVGFAVGHRPRDLPVHRESGVGHGLEQRTALGQQRLERVQPRREGLILLVCGQQAVDAVEGHLLLYRAARGPASACGSGALTRRRPACRGVASPPAPPWPCLQTSRHTSVICAGRNKSSRRQSGVSPWPAMCGRAARSAPGTLGSQVACHHCWVTAGSGAASSLAHTCRVAELLDHLRAVEPRRRVPVLPSLTVEYVRPSSTSSLTYARRPPGESGSAATRAGTVHWSCGVASLRARKTRNIYTGLNPHRGQADGYPTQAPRRSRHKILSARACRVVG